MSTDPQSQRELMIFREFAAKCPLPLVFERARKQVPVEQCAGRQSDRVANDSESSEEFATPDICCPLDDGGSLAFELVETTPPETQKAQGDSDSLEPMIHEEFLKAEQAGQVAPVADWNGFAVLVAFSSAATKHDRRNAVREVIAHLQETGPQSLRSTSFTNDAIRYIHIYDSPFANWQTQGPCIRVANAHFPGSAVVSVIQKKVGTRYRPKPPVHLLAHCEHSETARSWEANLSASLQQSLAASSFEKVWIYDRAAQDIIYCYPDE